jgi:outer membrane biosynthesis protein TonB
MGASSQAVYYDSQAVYYPDESEFCSHRPHVDLSWRRALVRHLEDPIQKNSLSEIQSLLLGFTVHRSGYVVNCEIVTTNREIVTTDQGDVVNGEIVRHSGNSEFENEVISMIDRAQPLPPFPDSMTEATLDLIVPIYVIPPPLNHGLLWLLPDHP